MNKKSTLIGIVTIAVVAIMVYGVVHLISNSVTKDSSSESSVKVDVVEEDTKGADVDAADQPDTLDSKDSSENSSANISGEDDNIFETLKSTSLTDAIKYANEYRQVLLTIDAGKIDFSKGDSLKCQFSAPFDVESETIFCVDFSDANNGIIMVNVDSAAGSSYYDVYITKDAGATWENGETAQIAGSVQNVYMIDENNGFLISTDNPVGTDIIYYTCDGAATWNALENEINDMENGTIYPVKISVDETDIIDVISADDEPSGATVFKLDKDWNVVDKYDISK